MAWEVEAALCLSVLCSTHSGLLADVTFKMPFTFSIAEYAMWLMYGNAVHAADEYQRRFRKVEYRPDECLHWEIPVHFQTNAEIHDINTRTKSNLHQALSHLSKYQKGTHCFGIKVFNSLLTRYKDLSHNIRQFESALKAFLYSHSFYTLDEYFNYNKT